MEASIMKERLVAMGINPISAIDFIKYHKERPEIWKEFERTALALINEGRDKLGAKAIVEQIRWEYSMNRKGEYKVQNSYVSLYARVFAIKYPHHADKFSFKEAVGPRREAA